MLIKEKVIKASNKCLSFLNKMNLTQNELILTLSQILIYSGHSITKKDIVLDSIDWNDLHNLYYSDNEKNDIGLGLMLNGAAITEALPKSMLDFVKGDVTANQGVLNGNQLSSTS